ncbi:hypothetical protein DENSPDRAFT_833925 [Dentipellis sp. KUC8613]|nr:hypothetical protein DENSPDRAFT_833925 [Dentipellis sp. KUC8613]
MSLPEQLATDTSILLPTHKPTLDMAQTLQASVGRFAGSLAEIGTSLVHSLIAVFFAVISLFQTIISSILHLTQSVVQLGLDVFQGVAGFAMANFFMIAVLGGAYYVYTTKYRSKRGGFGKSVQRK